MSTENEIPSSGTILFEHERRLGSAEGDIKLLKNRVTSVEQIAQLMISSFDDLKTTVVNGNKEQMQFLQKIVEHDQGLESIKIQFEQEMEKMKIEQKRQAEDFDRQQKVENKQMTWSIIRKFALWFAPTVTILVTVFNEWLEKYFIGF